MKKLIILFLLLSPFLVKAQSPVQGFCRSYNFVPPINSSNTTGQVVSGDSTSSMTFNNCTNLHITKCRISNNPGGNAITLNGCTNVIIDSCYIDMVGQGIVAQNSSTVIKILNNYFHNILGGPSVTWHPIQFKNVNSGGNRIQNNMIEEDPLVAPYTHDQISLFQSNGIAGDSIMVTGNWIRGGQQVKNAQGNNGAAGITAGDVGGSFQVIRGNKLINALAILIDGTGTSIKVDHNLSYAQQVAPQPNSIALLYFGAPGNNYVGNNLLNFRNSSGGIANVNPATSGTIAGWSTNTPNNTTSPQATATMIPTPMIATCTVSAPNISYNPATNIYTAGTTIGALNPSNSGGAITSWSINKPLPAGLSFNTGNGVITGTPTTATPIAIYTVTAKNSVGNSNFNITITVNSAPVAVPIITYSPGVNTYTQNTSISPLNPVSTGGGVVSYAIDKVLPTGLSFSTVTGQIIGTPTALSPSTLYTITASNASGTGRTTVTISVVGNPIQAPNISYNPSVFNTTYGHPITPATPVNTGSAAIYTVAPGLPFGWALDPATGTITANPASVHTSSSFVVTATNIAGQSQATITISVVAAPLVITAISMTKYVNTANPVLTVVYSGFLGTDNNTNALTVQPTVSTTATLNSPLGSYPITPTGAASNNYSINYANGILQVIPPNTTTITFRIIGGVVN